MRRTGKTVEDVLLETLRLSGDGDLRLSGDGDLRLSGDGDLFIEVILLLRGDADLLEDNSLSADMDLFVNIDLLSDNSLSGDTDLTLEVVDALRGRGELIGTTVLTLLDLDGDGVLDLDGDGVLDLGDVVEDEGKTVRRLGETVRLLENGDGLLDLDNERFDRREEEALSFLF